MAEDLLAKRKEEIEILNTTGSRSIQSLPSALEDPQSGMKTRRQARHETDQTGVLESEGAAGKDVLPIAPAAESHRSARPGARRGALGPFLNILRRQHQENGANVSLLDP